MDDTSRFEALFDTQFRAVLGYALRRSLEPADAADVAAEVFLTAWRRLDQVPAGQEARLWLFGVARNSLANARRGRLRRDALARRLRDDLAVHVRHLDHDAGPADAVRRALARLPAVDAEVLRLSVWEDLDPVEIAVVLGIPPGTARSRLHRARTRLRAHLEEAAPAVPSVTTPLAKEHP